MSTSVGAESKLGKLGKTLERTRTPPPNTLQKNSIQSLSEPMKLGTTR